MKAPICLLVVAFVAEIHCWIRLERVPVEDALLMKQGFVCSPTEFALGPMKASETTYLKADCAKASCDEKGTVEYQGCLLEGAPPHGCRLVQGGENLDYPECCPAIYCNPALETRTS